MIKLQLSSGDEGISILTVVFRSGKSSKVVLYSPGEMQSRAHIEVVRI